MFWTCTRHIPTPPIYMANVPHCPSCKATRPSLDVTAPVIPSAISLPPLEEDTTMEALPQVVTEESPTSPAVDVLPAPVLATVPSVEAPKRSTKVKRQVAKGAGRTDPLPPCAWPRCRNKARENSPYCSKVCSDRCGRVRRKTNLTPFDARLQASVLERMSRWSAWESVAP